MWAVARKKSGRSHAVAVPMFCCFIMTRLLLAGCLDAQQVEEPCRGVVVTNNVDEMVVFVTARCTFA